MPQPKKLPVITEAPAHSREAIAEWRDGIDAFIAWANLARRGETTTPEARQLDRILAAFQRGDTRVPFEGLALWAVLAGQHILTMLRLGDWHLTRCSICDQWLLAKDRRRALCRRLACVRTRNRVQRRAEYHAAWARRGRTRRRTRR